MTAEEVLNRINEQKKAIDGYPSKFIYVGTVDEYKVVVEALEKQIPKKPYKNRSEYYCPTCYEDERACVGKNHADGHRTRKTYCFNCGQRISWEECEEEK